MERLTTIDDANDARTPGSTRKLVYRVLETAEENDRLSRGVDIGLIVLIGLSVIAVVLESIPAVETRFASELYWFEAATVFVFSAEYLLRIWSSVEREKTPPASAFVSRLRFMFSFHAVIDLLAILPFYLLTFGLFGGVDMRFLRAIRLLRVLKLTRYSAALNMLVLTISENGRALAASFLILVTVMLLAASGMYYFERQVQPHEFGSIPMAMWWAFSTLTTVGYGDVVPVTTGGKIFGAMITVIGIGMVATTDEHSRVGLRTAVETAREPLQNRRDEALDDGILSDDEIKDLEELRIDLGLGRHTASQILDEGLVAAAIEEITGAGCCPHCGRRLPQR